IHSTAAVRATLMNALSMDTLLGAFCDTHWSEPPTDLKPLLGFDSLESGMSYRIIPLPGTPPPYTRVIASAKPANGPGMEAVHSAAYQIVDERTDGRLLIAPNVAELTAELREALATADTVLFDGTFWSDDEL